MSKIEYIPISECLPYKSNPRKNDSAVDVVAKSIKEFGFQTPIILDKNNVIIAGHTRLKAAEKLGLTEVPVIWADKLTPAQVKAFRIMDNKSAQYADWEMEMLKLEMQELDGLEYDLENTGFELREVGDILDDTPAETVERVNQLGKHTIECPKCKHKFERKENGK